MSTSQVKESIKIIVNVDIEYDAESEESRNEAIKQAVECTTCTNIYGWPVSVYTKSAKEWMKKR